MIRLKVVLALLAAVAFAGPASANVIDFGGLADPQFSNGTPLSSYGEDGYNLSFTNFLIAKNFGNPVPDVYSNTGGTASFELTKGGGSFFFASLDLAANNGDLQMSIQGYLNGFQVYGQGGGLAGQSGSFAFTTVNAVNGLDLLAVDSVIFTFTYAGSSMNVDNIVTNEVAGAVPEPSTWAMMILGFAGVSYMTYRRRKTAALAV